MSRAGLNKRRPSFPSAAPSAVLKNVDHVAEPSPPMALVKHGKYVLVGVGGCWWTGFWDGVGSVLELERGWVWRGLVLAIGLHAATVLIFLYLVLYLPWFRGYIPNYPKWQQSARLRSLVPALTLTILIGWTLYVISLSQAGKHSPLLAMADVVKAVGKADASVMRGTRGLGVFKSITGATSAYILTFGILGFIPAPSVGRKD